MRDPRRSESILVSSGIKLWINPGITVLIGGGVENLAQSDTKGLGGKDGKGCCNVQKRMSFCEDAFLCLQRLSKLSA